MPAFYESLLGELLGWHALLMNVTAWKAWNRDCIGWCFKIFLHPLIWGCVVTRAKSYSWQTGVFRWDCSAWRHRWAFSERLPRYFLAFWTFCSSWASSGLAVCLALLPFFLSFSFSFFFFLLVALIFVPCHLHQPSVQHGCSLTDQFFACG